MQELINFSVYSMDTGHFGDDWQAVADYVASHGLQGVELLVGTDLPQGIPSGLVHGVHLPFWVAWLDVWRGDPDAVDRYYPGLAQDHAQFLCGGRRPEEMVESLRALWGHTVALEAAYAVWNVAHVELTEAFTRQYGATDEEVTDATIELLNATAAGFPGNEPPTRLLLENLWWPGLTFRSRAITDRLIDGLDFTNWGFVLDIAHLLNTEPSIASEGEAVEYVNRFADGLPEYVGQRIEAVHLNLSLSGTYQRQSRGLPDGFHDLAFDERYFLAKTHVAEIDQHRPCTDPGWRELIARLEPAVVVHELRRNTLNELSARLAVQQAALQGIRNIDVPS